MLWCDVCGVALAKRPGALKQHNEGKRHAAMRFYGDADAGPVRRIEVRGPGGELAEALRPHEVSDAAAAAAAAAREMVRCKLLVHTGVVWQNKVWAMLNPEALCGAVLQLDAALLDAALWGLEDAAAGPAPTFASMIRGESAVSACFVLALAERVSRGAGDILVDGHARSARSLVAAGSAAPTLSLDEIARALRAMRAELSDDTPAWSVELRLAEREGELAEMSVAAALDAFAAALGSLGSLGPTGGGAGGGARHPRVWGGSELPRQGEWSGASERAAPRRLSLSLHLGRAVRQRRHAAVITRTLCAALACPATALGLRALRLDAAGDAWRAADEEAILAAAAAPWRAAAAAVLLGTHCRAGERSPLRTLPLALVRLVLEFARPLCEARVQVALRLFEPPDGPPAVEGGADLDFVASLCG